MKIILISGHYYKSKRKAGFHWLAKALHGLGHDITFVTTGISSLSHLTKDHRLQYKSLRKELNTLTQVEDRIASYIYFPLWHPVAMPFPFLERLITPFWNAYPHFPLADSFQSAVRQADVIVYESMNGLFFYDRFKKINATAKTIYRVSDDIRTHRSTSHRLLEIEQTILNKFDLISVPHRFLQEKKFSHSPNTKLHMHGIATSLFDADQPSPYKYAPNCIFVGVSLLDEFFIDVASKYFPQCHFTVIGPFLQHLKRANVHYLPEVPFESTVAYLKHADVGLVTLRYRNEHFSSFSDTLKVQQYRYCGLPIIAPDFISMNRDAVFYYKRDNENSIIEAIKKALMTPKDLSRGEEVSDWSSVAKKILQDLDRANSKN